jgi:hypothetical protein
MAVDDVTRANGEQLIASWRACFELTFCKYAEGA